MLNYIFKSVTHSLSYGCLVRGLAHDSWRVCYFILMRKSPLRGEPCDQGVGGGSLRYGKGMCHS